MSEIPRQLPDWYFKPITFRHLLTFLTSEKSNLILKISNPATFSPQFHIITLLSLFPFSLSARCLSLFPFSLSLHAVSLFSRSHCVPSAAPSGAAVRIASLESRMAAPPPLALPHHFFKPNTTGISLPHPHIR
jgi:hypothetical protein